MPTITVQPSLENGSSFAENFEHASDLDWLLIMTDGFDRGTCFNLSKIASKYKAEANTIRTMEEQAQSPVVPGHQEIIERSIKRRKELLDDILTIGRLPSLIIRLKEETVSSCHCRLRFDAEDKWYITDLNSTNFTYLDDIKIEPGREECLNEGSFVQIAFTRCIVGRKQWLLKNRKLLIETILISRSLVRSLEPTIPYPIVVGKLQMQATSNELEKSWAAFNGIEHAMRFLCGVYFGIITGFGDHETLRSTALRLVQWKKLEQFKPTMGSWLSLVKCLAISIKTAKGKPKNIPDWFFDSIIRTYPDVEELLTSILEIRNRYAHNTLQVKSEDFRQLTRLMDRFIEVHSFMSDLLLISTDSFRLEHENSELVFNYNSYVLNGKSNLFKTQLVPHRPKPRDNAPLGVTALQDWCYIYFDEKTAMIPLAPFVLYSNHERIPKRVLFVKESISWDPGDSNCRFISIDYGVMKRQNPSYHNDAQFFDLLMEASFA